MNSRGRGEEGVDDIRPDNLLVINLDFHTANPVDGGAVSVVLFHRSLDQQADGFRSDVTVPNRQDAITALMRSI